MRDQVPLWYATVLMFLGMLIGVFVTQAFWGVGLFAPPACAVEDGGPDIPCVWDGGVPEQGSGRRTIILYLPAEGGQ